jgi:hypothetical protein
MRTIITRAIGNTPVIAATKSRRDVIFITGGHRPSAGEKTTNPKSHRDDILLTGGFNLRSLRGQSLRGRLLGDQQGQPSRLGLREILSLSGGWKMTVIFNREKEVRVR